jgi:hypothetical protein
MSPLDNIFLLILHFIRLYSVPFLLAVLGIKWCPFSNICISLLPCSNFILAMVKIRKYWFFYLFWKVYLYNLLTFTWHIWIFLCMIVLKVESTTLCIVLQYGPLLFTISLQEDKYVYSFGLHMYPGTWHFLSLLRPLFKLQENDI